MKKEKEIVNLFENDRRSLAVDEDRKSVAMQILQRKVDEKSIIPKATFGEIMRMQITFMNKKMIVLQIFAFFVFMWIYVKAGRTIDYVDLYLLGTVAAALFSVFLVISCFGEEQYKVAELAGSCYFNNRQLCLLRMILSGGINLIILSVIIIYTENLTKNSLLQVGMYVLVPYLMAGCIHFLVMLFGSAAGGMASVWGGAAIVLLCSSGGLIFPQLYEETAIGAWVAGLIIFGGIYVAEIVGILKQMERGERLCMS